MSIVDRIDLGQVLTMSLADRQSRIEDICANANPLTSILKSEGRIKSVTKTGPELHVPVRFDKLTANWYKNYDVLDVEVKETINSAVFAWSNLAVLYGISDEELSYNRGEAQIINLITEKMTEAEIAMREAWEAGLASDGTGSGGQQLLGLQAAIPTLPNVGIYGGINRANVAKWRTSSFNIPNGDVAGYTTWDSTTARQIVNRILSQRSRGRNYADLLIADALSYEAFDQATVALQRFVTETGSGDRATAKQGFSGITLNTPAGPVDVVMAGGIGNLMPANTIYGIDTSTMTIYQDEGTRFVPFHPGSQGLRPINQDAYVQGLKWRGQLVQTNPLFNFVIKTAA